MNLALSESLGQELRFAKRINSNGVTELKLWTKEVWIQICLNSNFKTFKNMFKLFYWIEEIITKKWALVSSKTEVRIKRYDQKKFDYETNFEIWKLKKKLMWQVHWIGENKTKLCALVSSNLDERVKSYGYLKNQGQAVLQKKKK